MSKKVLPLQRILVLCGHLCPTVKREPGENPGQTTLLCFPAKLQHTLYYRHCQDRVRFINCLSQIISDF